MDLVEARRQGDELLVVLGAFFRVKKNKGKAKASTSKVVDIAGEDLSFLPPVIMVLASSLCNMPLETNVGVPLKPMGSS